MRLQLFAVLLLLCACAGPKPCTLALCVTKLDGTMELTGWGSAVRASTTTPKPPVVSDTTVAMIAGSAELRNGKTTISAAEGSSFLFTVSTRSVASITVSTGSVTIVPEVGAPIALAPGAPYALPKPR